MSICNLWSRVTGAVTGWWSRRDRLVRELADARLDADEARQRLEKFNGMMSRIVSGAQNGGAPIGNSPAWVETYVEALRDGRDDAIRVAEADRQAMTGMCDALGRIGDDLTALASSDRIDHFTIERMALETLGTAIDRGRRVFVVGHRENLFCWIDQVRFLPDFQAVLAALA